MSIENDCVYQGLTRLYPDLQDQIRTSCIRWQKQGSDGSGTRLMGVLIDLITWGAADAWKIDRIEAGDTSVHLTGNRSVPVIVAIDPWREAHETDALGHVEVFLTSDFGSTETEERIATVKELLCAHGGVIYRPNRFNV